VAPCFEIFNSKNIENQGDFEAKSPFTVEDEFDLVSGLKEGERVYIKKGFSRICGKAS